MMAKYDLNCDFCGAVLGFIENVDKKPTRTGMVCPKHSRQELLDAKLVEDVEDISVLQAKTKALEAKVTALESTVAKLPK